MKTIALIEFGNSHDECFESQVRFLINNGYTVHLIINEQLKKRVSHLQNDYTYSFKPSLWETWKVVKYIKKSKITKAIINTSSGNHVRQLTFLLPKWVNVTGILHNAKKLKESASQKFISKRIKKYFVLNDYIKERCHDEDSKIKIESFYPIFFKDYKEAGNISNLVNDKFLNVCIPGSLDLKRRDYFFLLNNLNQETIKNIRFLFLGKTNPNSKGFLDFKEKASEKSMEGSFIFFNDFINEPTFYEYIKSSDLIMPLIHPSKAEYSDYGSCKIAGSFNLAFGFKKPLLMESTWMTYSDFSSTSIFYNSENINDTLLNLVTSKNELKRLEDNYNSIEKFKLGFQEQKYIKFIESI